MIHDFKQCIKMEKIFGVFKLQSHWVPAIQKEVQVLVMQPETFFGIEDAEKHIAPLISDPDNSSVFTILPIY